MGLKKNKALENIEQKKNPGLQDSFFTHNYSTVTLLAKFLGLSTSNPLETLT